MLRRAALPLALLLLAAGCLNGDEAPAGTVTETLPETSPTEAPSAPGDALPEDEVDGEPAEFTLYFDRGYTLTSLRPTEEGAEPETADPATFYTLHGDQSPAWSPWASQPTDRARELVGDATVLINIRANQPATQTTPKVADFPGVGGWIGSGDSYNLFYLAHDAPERMEAGVTYAVQATVSLPEGGLLLLPGEVFSPHPWAAYETADGSPVEYVVGGDDPARVSVMTRFVDWPSTTPVEILTQSGEMGPHPGFTTAGNPDAVSFPLTVPEHTLYVVIETSGVPKLPGRADVDVDVRQGSTSILGGQGPGAAERVVIGPGNLAAFGHDLTVHLTSASTGGNTWSVTATAYVYAPPQEPTSTESAAD